METPEAWGVEISSTKYMCVSGVSPECKLVTKSSKSSIHCVLRDPFTGYVQVAVRSLHHSSSRSLSPVRRFRSAPRAIPKASMVPSLPWGNPMACEQRTNRWVTRCGFDLTNTKWIGSRATCFEAGRTNSSAQAQVYIRTDLEI